jgi:hypothetical protein
MAKAAKRVGRTEPEESVDKRYYRIGEVSRITEVKPYVLRYWESEFRWMAPQKSRSKQRLYRRRDIDIILLIKKLLYEQRHDRRRPPKLRASWRAARWNPGTRWSRPTIATASASSATSCVAIRAML